MKYYRCSLIILLFLFSYKSIAEPIRIIAAENFYGDVAKILGGIYVQVDNILKHPNQNPHLFSSSVNTAKLLSNANIIVYNGLGYDTWINRLINITPQAYKINVSAVIHKKSGDNPHIWYDPQTMPIYANVLTALLIKIDPIHQQQYQQQLKKMQQNYQLLNSKIKWLKQHYQGTPVIATEPLFNYMAQAIGLDMHGKYFQNHVMNDIEPSPEEIKNFQNDLRKHKVKLLIYNNQVTNPLIQHLITIAKEEHLPCLGLNELLPMNLTYLEWMTELLQQLELSLNQLH